MKKAKELTRISQIAYPSIPGRIAKAVSEASEDKGEDEHDIGRVQSDNDVRDYMATTAEDGNTALSDTEMQPVVEDGGRDVSYKWRDEDHGYDGVGQVVVLLKLSLSC